MKYASFLMSHLPRVNLNIKTPYELFYEDTKPDYSMIKVFGCSCYPIINPELRKSKLHKRSYEFMFVGAYSQRKGFLLLDLSTMTLHTSSQVRFNDEEFPLLKGQKLGGPRINNSDSPYAVKPQLVEVAHPMAAGPDRASTNPPGTPNTVNEPE